MNKTSIRSCHLSVLICFIVFAALSFACTKVNNSGNTKTVACNTYGGVLISGSAKSFGVNYNASLQEISFGKLTRSKTKWVRGLPDIFYHYDNNNLTTSFHMNESYPIGTDFYFHNRALGAQCNVYRKVCGIIFQGRSTGLLFLFQPTFSYQNRNFSL